MDLFVINRHKGDNTSVETNQQDDEKSKLNSVLKRIERNKKLRKNQKEREKFDKLVKNYYKEKHREEREQKRIKKSQLVPIPESDQINQQFLIEPIDDEQPENESTDVNNESTTKKQKSKLANLEGFTVLGGNNFNKKTKVKRVLPAWILKPVIISTDLHESKTKVENIELLDSHLKKELKNNKIKYFFPVQAAVIPWLLKSNRESEVMFPRDICVSAPTGSGKTLAFVLPVIQALTRYKLKKIRALAVLPTQDLAYQIFKSFKLYTKNIHLDVGLISGRNSFSKEQKQLITNNIAYGYLSNIDILVCTPGRLVDHIKGTEGFDLKHLEFIIIDEADRVLDNIQNDWLYHLEKHTQGSDTPRKRILNVFALQQQDRPPQKLLFSSTLSDDPEKLEKLSLFQPKLFTTVKKIDQNTSSMEISESSYIGKYAIPKELKEKYIVCSMELKPLVLYEFIKSENLTKLIIFTHSIETTHRLKIILQALFKDNRKIEEISSITKNRTELMRKFNNDEIDLLICTDSLARGIDLPHVKCVINYSAPKYIKTYIHRTGRTARAGEDGLAVTLLLYQHINKFKNLLSDRNIEEIKIPEENLESLADQYKKALKKLKKNIMNEKKIQLKKIKQSKRKIKKKNLKTVSTMEIDN